MKRTVILVSLSFIFMLSLCSQDLIILKNGREINGRVQEVNYSNVLYQTSDTTDWKLHMVPYDDVFMIKYANGSKIVLYDDKPRTPSSRKINLDNYGGYFSMGFHLFGGGIMGVSARAYLVKSRFAIESGVSLRPVYVPDGKREGVYIGGLISGGPVVHFSKKYKPYKGKVTLNGMSLKAGYSICEIKNGLLTLNWARESFKENHPERSFIFELGAGISFMEEWTEYTDYGGWYGGYTSYYGGPSPMLFIKCHWNNYLTGNKKINLPESKAFL